MKEIYTAIENAVSNFGNICFTERCFNRLRTEVQKAIGLNDHLPMLVSHTYLTEDMMCISVCGTYFGCRTGIEIRRKDNGSLTVEVAPWGDYQTVSLFYSALFVWMSWMKGDGRE